MAIPFSPSNTAKRQAASGKRQAASGKRQAASGKRQAASGKRQAASGKRGFTGWNLLPLEEPKLNHSRTDSVNLGPVSTTP
jgi:hypothetical protein